MRRHALAERAPWEAAAVSALIARTMRESNARDYPPERLEALIAYFTAYFTPEKLRRLAEERHCLVALVGDEVVGTAGPHVCLEKPLREVAG